MEFERVHNKQIWQNENKLIVHDERITNLEDYNKKFEKQYNIDKTKCDNNIAEITIIIKQGIIGVKIILGIITVFAAPTCLYIIYNIFDLLLSYAI